ncbi:MAG: 16S rRNA (cytosine(1402)-N(4))-methyltransferase RsmH [candidate division WOR-3 bacterium]|nr:16S rRNA (cytosine(1402)-N(4))-methyltransferase RsmH [candidate division WOR-3 bacterium]MCX7757341.1 16S rRNA (cytosine(1402)-N(4))-methyltransferase RsmH [candidate division WOR-3 bacterium]MDW7988263.1 16S rRNA (cytosine(1402)-N(4))-methyltransferase RsmH [candidate division WOR-3 bacterium]
MNNVLTNTSQEVNVFHVPVMVDEVIYYLSPAFNNQQEKVIFVDATIGGGGHTEKILQYFKIDIVVGIDWDKDAIDYCKRKFKQYKNVYLFNKNYVEIDCIINKFAGYQVKGILFDYGVSLYQLRTPSRGFSYQTNGILDMRFSQTDLTKRAKEIIKESSYEYLARIFKVYGEERFARKIALTICKNRQKINTTMDVVNLVKSTVPQHSRRKALARIFQALRIAVNNELYNIQTALQKAISILSPTGRIVCLSYHSLEDRLVKNVFKQNAQLKTLKIITKKPVTPLIAEIQANPQARSAKLRAAEKLEQINA